MILTRRIAELKDQRKEPYEVFLKHVWEEMKAYVYAYAERVALEGSLKVMSGLRDPEILYEVKLHFVISTLDYILEHMAFYAYSGLIPQGIAEGITVFRNKLIK